MRELERRVVLSVLDRKWREHLYEMDYLREGIYLRAYSQRDPLVEYQREGFDMFAAMMDGIKEESVGFLFNLEVQVTRTTSDGARGSPTRSRSRCDATLRSRQPEQPADAPRPPPQIRAKGLDQPQAPQQKLSYSAPRGPGARRADRATARPRSPAGRTVTNADDEFAGVGPQRAVPVRLGQEVQAVPRRPGRPHRADHPRHG